MNPRYGILGVVALVVGLLLTNVSFGGVYLSSDGTLQDDGVVCSNGVCTPIRSTVKAAATVATAPLRLLSNCASGTCSTSTTVAAADCGCGCGNHSAEATVKTYYVRTRVRSVMYATPVRSFVKRLGCCR